MTVSETIKTEEFSLEGVKKNKGKFCFVAESLNEDFECEEGLKRLARDSVNKSYIWRHNHPIQEGNEETHIYGRVDNAYVKDGKLISEYEVYSHTPDHIALQNLIEKRLENEDPLGVSMQYRTYSNDKGVIHYDVYEHSGTPFPKCEDCKTIESGIKTMENEKKETEEKELEEENSDIEEQISELESLLNSKTKKLEEYESKITKLEGKIEAEKEDKMTMEDKVNELQKQVKYLEKKPLIDKIHKLEGRDGLIDYYKTLSTDELKKELEVVQKRNENAQSHVETKEMESTATEAEADDNVNEEEKEKITYEEFTRNL